MLNRNPVFFNCFTQGGSNILWNIVVSHPDMCSPVEEFHSNFHNGVDFGMGKHRRPLHWINFSWSGIGVTLLTGQPRLFDVRNTRSRRKICSLAAKIIDRRLYRAKFAMLDDPDYSMKSKDVPYTREEIKGARLCVKGNNGLIFLNPLLREMYPDIRFIALARHPLAVYESWKRRNIVSEPQEFVAVYQPIAEKMIEERDAYGSLFLRYEDLVERPQESITSIYEYLGLTVSPSTLIRLKAKPHYQKDGSYRSSFMEGAYFWFPLSDVEQFLKKDVNELQMAALDPVEKSQIMGALGKVLSQLGY